MKERIVLFDWKIIESDFFVFAKNLSSSQEYFEKYDAPFNDGFVAFKNQFFGDEKTLFITYNTTRSKNYLFINLFDLLPSQENFDDVMLLEIIKSDLGYKINQKYNSIKEEMEQNVSIYEKIWSYLEKSSYQTKIDMIEYFNFNEHKIKYLGKTLPTIMALGLGAGEQGTNTTLPILEWQKPDNLILDNSHNCGITEYVDNNTHFISENPSYTFVLCGVEHKIGKGGIHAAKKQIKASWGFILDMEGYYTIVQLAYNMLSRKISPSGKQKVFAIREERNRRKENGDITAKSFKEGILSIWGSMGRKGHPLYDPSMALNLSFTGQLFIIDLLLKLEPYIVLHQTNTDGIFLTPLDAKENGEDFRNITRVVNEWTKRTNFKVKIDKFTNLWQKDVSNYVCIVNEKKIVAKGGYVNAWNSNNDNFWDNNIGEVSRQGAIIDKALVNYMLKDIPIEKTINEETNLLMFQYTARVGKDNDKYDVLLNGVKVDKVNRVFAGTSGKLLKCKSGTTATSKIPSLPENVYIDNDLTKEEQLNRLWYIDKALKRLNDYTGAINKQESIFNLPKEKTNTTKPIINLVVGFDKKKEMDDMIAILKGVKDIIFDTVINNFCFGFDAETCKLVMTFKENCFITKMQKDTLRMDFNESMIFENTKGELIRFVPKLKIKQKKWVIK